MKTLVTGGTGLVGNNVIRLLLDRGQRVRALVRPTSDRRPLEGLDVEIVQGDVVDADAVRAACQGVSAVIHAAAYVHFGWSGKERHRAVNVQGTQNVADAAHRVGARLLYVSSTDALGVGTPEVPANEDSPREGKFPCWYAVTKREAEQAVRGYIGRGLDAVIVNPALMLGPWDWKPSSGRMLLEVAQRFTPFSPAGGISVCDVRDVVAAILTACEQAKTGQQYILAGENLTYHEIWCLLAEVSGGSKPWMRAMPWMQFVGGRFGDLLGRITGHEPDVNSAAVAISRQFHYYSSERARLELGYRSRPFRESVRDAWEWLVAHGYVTPRAARRTPPQTLGGRP